MTTVRNARPSDAAAITDAHVRSWRATYEGRMPEEVIAGVERDRAGQVQRMRQHALDAGDRAGFLVAEDGGVVRGFARFGPARPELLGENGLPAPPSAAEAGEVYALYVDPSSQGRGLGRALLERALEDLAGCGFAGAVVQVLESNERALRFYRSAGFLPSDSVRQVRLAGHEVPHRVLRCPLRP